VISKQQNCGFGKLQSTGFFFQVNWWKKPVSVE